MALMNLHVFHFQWGEWAGMHRKILHLKTKISIYCALHVSLPLDADPPIVAIQLECPGTWKCLKDLGPAGFH